MMLYLTLDPNTNKDFKYLLLFKSYIVPIKNSIKLFILIKHLYSSIFRSQFKTIYLLYNYKRSIVYPDKGKRDSLCDYEYFDIMNEVYDTIKNINDSL
jgi:hypothetical protein